MLRGIMNRNQKIRFFERDITHFLFILPNFLLYSFLSVFPIFLGFYYSVTDWNGVSPKYDIIGISNYIKLLNDPRFKRAFSFNVRYTLMLIVSVTVLAIILGLLLNKSFRGRTYFRALYFFPAVLSMVVIGLIFNEIYFRGGPLIGNTFNIESLKKSILSSPYTAIYGVLLANVWKSVAIPTVLVISGLQTIPQEIVESAYIDGANRWHEFKYITIPFILPMISVILVLTLREGLMIFDYIMSLTQGGPAGSTESITMMIYRFAFEEMKFSSAIAEAVLMSLIIMTVSFIQIRYTNSKRIYQ
jgi:raffinose/stachyose/melibiose transport system permease protein